MPAIAPAVKNALTIIKSTTPAFSGVNGQIDMTGGGLTKAGQKIDEKGALRVAAIWIACTILADEVASLSMRIVKKGDKTREPQEPPSLKSLWGRHPNPDQTRFGIDATETLSMVLWGFSATMLNWTRGKELGVRWPIDPNGLTFERTDAGGMRLHSYSRGDLTNDPGKLPEFEYCPMYTLPGSIEPVSPVKMAAELAGLSLAYDEAAARLMGRGMNPTAVLTTGEAIDDPEAERLAKRLERLHGGSGNGGKIAVLGGKDLKLERMTMSMADAEFIAQNDRVFSILMAMWRVPPTVAGMVDKPSTWGTGVAEFALGLQRFTLRPLVERRQEAKEKYITEPIDPALQVRYPFDSLLSASPQQRTEIQARRLTNNMTSVERILAQEDEPPFGEDETVFSPLNLGTDEDRRLQRLSIQADAYGALIRAGATPEAAAAETGFDPAKLKSTGLAPVTLQTEGGA